MLQEHEIALGEIDHTLLPKGDEDRNDKKIII
jgi:hypothetical protein